MGEMSLRGLAKYWLYSSIPGFAGRFPYYGTTVHFPPRAPLFRVICRNGRFEPEIIDRLIQLARPATTVFDVGANLGLMAIPVLRACGSCRVVSFEPSPNSLSFLRQTISGSEFGDRWTLIEKAMSNQTGEVDFTVGRPEDALFEGFKSGDRIADACTIAVKVSTLDAEWQALGRPPVSAVKIDVEGAEQQVLDGAHALLADQRPAVLLEWHDAYLQRFGTPPPALLEVAQRYRYQIFTVPHGVPVADAAALRVQMMSCQNFLLLFEGAP
jgi:FkbM family methyltransferase